MVIDSVRRGNAPRTLRRALLGQLDECLSRLRKPTSSEATVHSVRKELKRARATLRLLRGCLGEELYHRQNRMIRDAARPLGAVRDAKVLQHAVTELRRGLAVATQSPPARCSPVRG